MRLEWAAEHLYLAPFELLDIFSEHGPCVWNIVMFVFPRHCVPTKEVDHAAVFLVFLDN